MMNWEGINEVLGQVDLPGVAREILSDLLEEIDSLVEEGAGLDDLRDIFGGDLGDWPPGDTGRGQQHRGRGQINMIPSDITGPCRTILLAIASRRRGTNSVQSILGEVFSHLERCRETRLVVLLTPQFDPARVEKQWGSLMRAHYEGGKCFVILFGNPPTVPLSLIRINWRRFGK